jgi:hypothetical protein
MIGSRARIAPRSFRQLLFEESAHFDGTDVAFDEGLPDRAREDEGQLAALDLLVLREPSL